MPDSPSARVRPRGVVQQSVDPTPARVSDPTADSQFGADEIPPQYLPWYERIQRIASKHKYSFISQVLGVFGTYACLPLVFVGLAMMTFGNYSDGFYLIVSGWVMYIFSR